MRRGGQIKFVILPESDKKLQKQLRGYCLHASRLIGSDHDILRRQLEPLFKRLRNLVMIRVHGLGDNDVAFGYPVYYIDLEGT